VNSSIITRLVDLNHQFYQTFAGDFAATRQRIQPGVRRILDGIPLDGHLLDLGCGSGGVAGELARRGFSGAYTGLDFSPQLLEEAERNLAKAGPVRGSFTFQTADLSQPGWSSMVGEQRFDTLLAFAVLHHLPGEGLRRQVLTEAKDLFVTGSGVQAGGQSRQQLVLSVWQFLNSPRLAGRVVAWERAGLSQDRVDPGDYLLDWRAGGVGLRYVHLFSEDELKGLGQACGYRVDGEFYSDGKEGNLSLYQVWLP